MGGPERTVTVTIPIYDSSNFIEDCIRNLLEQTYPILEILLVVDSRTTDNSLDIISSLAINDGRIRFIEQMDENGLSGARNIGIMESKGEVIWFLDVDDIPSPFFLEELIRIMDETDADTVICNHYQTFKKEVKPIPDKDYDYKTFGGKYAVANFTDFPIYSWSRIQKRTVFNEESMFRKHLSAEDIEQTVRQYVSSKTVCYYNKPLYQYIKRKNSSTTKNRKRDVESLEDTARSLLPYIKIKMPESYDSFKRRMVENLIRQSTFSKYSDYCIAYKKTISHKVIEEIEGKSLEMKIYSFSKFLYYAILFPFSHFLWDNKEGYWGSINLK